MKLMIGHAIFLTSGENNRMRLLLINERLFLFGEFTLSKSQYLYNKLQYFALSNLQSCNRTVRCNQRLDSYISQSS